MLRHRHRTWLALHMKRSASQLEDMYTVTVTAQSPWLKSSARCRGASQGPSDAGLSSAQFSLAYERHERVGKIGAANAAQKMLVPGAHACTRSHDTQIPESCNIKPPALFHASACAVFWVGMTPIKIFSDYLCKHTLESSR